MKKLNRIPNQPAGMMAIKTFPLFAVLLFQASFAFGQVVDRSQKAQDAKTNRITHEISSFTIIGAESYGAFEFLYSAKKDYKSNPSYTAQKSYPVYQDAIMSQIKPGDTIVIDATKIYRHGEVPPDSIRYREGYAGGLSHAMEMDGKATVVAYFNPRYTEKVSFINASHKDVQATVENYLNHGLEVKISRIPGTRSMIAESVKLTMEQFGKKGMIKGAIGTVVMGAVVPGTVMARSKAHAELLQTEEAPEMIAQPTRIEAAK